MKAIKIPSLSRFLYFYLLSLTSLSIAMTTVSMFEIFIVLLFSLSLILSFLPSRSTSYPLFSFLLLSSLFTSYLSFHRILHFPSFLVSLPLCISLSCIYFTAFVSTILFSLSVSFSFSRSISLALNLSSSTHTRACTRAVTFTGCQRAADPRGCACSNMSQVVAVLVLEKLEVEAADDNNGGDNAKDNGDGHDITTVIAITDTTTATSTARTSLSNSPP